MATSGAKKIFVYTRDRAMLLLSSTTAFRGESSRILEWSDLFVSSIRMDDIQTGYTIPVLAALADNAKHNQNGRLDVHGAIRHREVELCPVGGIAFLFFAYFHVAGFVLPPLVPNFTDTTYGEFGRREWYAYHVFSTKHPAMPMSYDSKHHSFSIPILAMLIKDLTMQAIEIA